MNRGQVVVAVACAMLAALLLFRFWRPGVTQAGDANTRSEQEATPAHTEATSASPLGDSMPADARRDVTAAAQPITIDGAQVQVRVSGPDGAALPGLTVHHMLNRETWHGLDQAGRDEWDRLRFDEEARLERFGQRAVTDAQGIARWPWRESDQWWIVAARQGASWGQTWIRAMAEPSEVHALRLQPEISLSIQVLDARQEPAAEVEVEAAFEGVDELGKSASQGQALAVTGADGRAEARNLQTWAPRVMPRGNSLPVRLQPRLPAVNVARDIDLVALPREPVVIHLPPTGSIEVTVLTALGEPAADDTVRLLPHPPGDGQRGHSATTNGAGIGVFPRVGLGQQWSVSVHRPTGRLAKVIAGPADAGQVVQVVLHPEAAPVLYGRVLWNGQPAAHVGLWFSDEQKALTANPVRTDDQGRFRFAADLGSWLGRRVTTLASNATAADGASDGRTVRWTGNLLLTAGEHDLGALHLAQLPIVAAGRLITRSGNLDHDSIGLVVEAAIGGEDQPWQPAGLTRRLLPDGSFTFFGTTPNAPLRLQVWTYCAWLPVPPLPFTAGATDLSIALEKGGSVKASVVAGSSLAAFCLTPLLLPMAAPAQHPDPGRYQRGIDPAVPTEQTVVEDDAWEVAYTWPAVLPGRYRLLIKSRGVTQPLIEVADIVVSDGECNQEARLQNLTLPGLKVLVLTLPQAAALIDDDALGTGRGAGVVFVLDGDTPTDQCMQVDGKLLVFAATRPMDFLVRLNGHRDLVLRSVFEDRTVELQPGIAVDLRCEGLELPAGGTLTFGLTPVDDPLTRAQSWVFSPAAGGSVGGGSFRSASVPAVFADGVARAALPVPGRYRLGAQLRAEDGGSQAVTVTPGELQIGDSGGDFAVQVALPK